jgi:DNA polymerase-3 subunit gamma/tau
MLTREAWNALLKILEEPPPRVVFVFATTEPQKIAQTAAPVLSRLQRFDFKRMGLGDIKDRLTHVLDEEHVTSEPDALAMIARAADGSMRDALSLADQVLAMGDGRVDTARVRDALGLVAEDEFIALLDLLADRRAADVFPLVSRLADAGIDFGTFLTGLADILRAQLAVALGGSAPDISERARTALQERRSRWSAADLLRMLAALAELEPRFRKSGQQQLLVETLLVRLALLDRTLEIEDLLRGLGGEGSGRAETAGIRRDQIPARMESRAAPPARPDERIRDDPARSSRSRPGADQAVAAPPVAILADRPASSRSAAPPLNANAPERSLPLDLSSVAGCWDELVTRLRTDGKRVLASALSRALPVAVTAAGDVSIQLDEANEFFEHAIETGRGDIQAVLREWFPSAARVQLRGHTARGAASPPTRLTDEMVRTERLTALRKRDPLLGAAIDALDLDVLD